MPELTEYDLKTEIVEFEQFLKWDIEHMNDVMRYYEKYRSQQQHTDQIERARDLDVTKYRNVGEQLVCSTSRYRDDKKHDTWRNSLMILLTP